MGALVERAATAAADLVRERRAAFERVTALLMDDLTITDDQVRAALVR